MRNNIPLLPKKNLDSYQNPKNFHHHKIEMKDCSQFKRQVPKLYQKSSPKEPYLSNQKAFLNSNNAWNKYVCSSFFGNGISYFEQDPNNPLHFVQYFLQNDEDLNNYAANENEFYFELFKLYDCYCEFEENKKKNKKNKNKKKKKKKKGPKNQENEPCQSIKNTRPPTEERFLSEFEERLLKRENNLYKL